MAAVLAIKDCHHTSCCPDVATHLLLHWHALPAHHNHPGQLPARTPSCWQPPTSSQCPPGCLQCARCTPAGAAAGGPWKTPKTWLVMQLGLIQYIKTLSQPEKGHGCYGAFVGGKTGVRTHTLARWVDTANMTQQVLAVCSSLGCIWVTSSRQPSPNAADQPSGILMSVFCCQETKQPETSIQLHSPKQHTMQRAAGLPA